MEYLCMLIHILACVQTSIDVTNSRLATRFSKSTGSFGRGDSFDLGSPRTSSIDGTSSPTKAFERNGSSRSHDFDSYGSLGSLTTSKDSNKMSSFFGGNSSPKATPASSLFGGSPVAPKRDDGFNGSFLRFDSFGPGSPVAPPRASGEWILFVQIGGSCLMCSGMKYLHECWGLSRGS